MPGYVYYVLGFFTLPIILCVMVVVSAAKSTAGPYALYEHVVDDKGSFHDHAIKTIIPQFFRLIILERQKKRCIYGKLGKTPEKAYDDEVAYIVATDLHSPGMENSFWDEAVLILDERYQKGYVDSRGCNEDERIAEAQLQRQNA